MAKQYKRENLFVVLILILSSVILAYALYSQSRVQLLKTVAEVNGRQITDDDLQEVMITVPQQLRANLTNEILVEQAINLEIIQIEAEKLGITVSASEVDDSISKTLNSLGVSIDEFLNAAKSQGISERTLKNAYKKQLIALKFVNATISSKINISEEEIKSAYEAYSSQIGLSFEEARPQIENALKIQKGQLRLEAFLQQKRQEYIITRLS